MSKVSKKWENQNQKKFEELGTDINSFNNNTVSLFHNPLSLKLFSAKSFLRGDHLLYRNKTSEILICDSKAYSDTKTNMIKTIDINASAIIEHDYLKFSNTSGYKLIKKAIIYPDFFNTKVEYEETISKATFIKLHQIIECGYILDNRSQFSQVKLTKLFLYKNINNDFKVSIVSYDKIPSRVKVKFKYQKGKISINFMSGKDIIYSIKNRSTNSHWGITNQKILFKSKTFKDHSDMIRYTLSLANNFKPLKPKVSLDEILSFFKDKNTTLSREEFSTQLELSCIDPEKAFSLLEKSSKIKCFNDMLFLPYEEI